MGKVILSIETSCDETAIAIADFTRTKVRVLSHIVLSQIPVHKKFGGVVPNLAKREHQRNLVPILLTALGEAGLRNPNFQILISKQISKPKTQKIEKILEREQDLFVRIREYVLPLKPPPVDAIAVTYGPGLAPALWVGINFAKALAYLWEKPLIPVDHMAGHLYSAFLEKGGKKSKFKIQNSKFPTVALLVSGGHTQLVLMRGHGRFKILGETLDDAAGEAFDKVARILGLGYPGGPKISKLADSLKSYEVQPHKISLPRPMLNSKNYNFSFSGLKTAVLYLVRDLGPKQTKYLRPLIAKEFQNAVVEVLVKKTIRAAKEYKVKAVLLGGGVAANKLLRQKLSGACEKELSNVRCQLSEVALTGDNALMIALAAYFSGKKKSPTEVGADANLRLES